MRRIDTIPDEFRMALMHLIRKTEADYDADFLREGVWVPSLALMELTVIRHSG